MADVTITEIAAQQVLAALHTAQAGLEWYRDRCPDAVDGSDDEADAEIDAAMTALSDALTPSVPSPHQTPKGGA